jgi:TatD DNase family protein
VPVRGRKNEPAYVAFTCAQLAQLRGEAPEELARAAAANARTLLKLPA